jgi:hypothetical protein
MWRTRQQWQTHFYIATCEVSGNKPSRAKERVGNEMMMQWTSMLLIPVVAVEGGKTHKHNTTKQCFSPMRNERPCSKNDDASIVMHRDICPKTAQRKGKHQQCHQLGPWQPKHRQNQHPHTKDLLNQGMREEVREAPST